MTRAWANTDQAAEHFGLSWSQLRPVFEGYLTGTYLKVGRRWMIDLDAADAKLLALAADGVEIPALTKAAA